jgi:hypothetical protein
MDSMALSQVTGYPEHPPIGSLSRRERGLTAVSQETRRPEKNRSIMDSMALFQVTGYPEHPPTGSLSRREEGTDRVVFRYPST